MLHKNLKDGNVWQLTSSEEHNINSSSSYSSLKMIDEKLWPHWLILMPTSPEKLLQRNCTFRWPSCRHCSRQGFRSDIYFKEIKEKKILVLFQKKGLHAKRPSRLSRNPIRLHWHAIITNWAILIDVNKDRMWKKYIEKMASNWNYVSTLFLHKLS